MPVLDANAGDSGDDRKSEHRAELLAHYADIIEAGGLARALRNTAEELGLNIGNVAATSDRWVGVHSSASSDSSRGWIRVGSALDRRSFSVTLGTELGFLWAEGRTPSLAEVAAVISAWRGGAPLQALEERFPFLDVSQRGKDYEAGKSPMEGCWDILLTDQEFGAEFEMLTVLHSEPSIRALRPEFSFRVLRLFSDPYGRDGDFINIQPTDGETWSVWSSRDEEEVYVQLSAGRGLHEYRPREGKALIDVSLSGLVEAVKSFL
jgi:hypothetical protein